MSSADRSRGVRRAATRARPRPRTRAQGAAALAALDDDERRNTVVLACDTVVALDGRVYGKPADAAKAREYCAALAGRTHEVLGALAIAGPDGTLRERTDLTKVTFAELAEAEIAAYVATGEWRERAGGYAIQGAGGAIVERIEGDYLNVVGLRSTRSRPRHGPRAAASAAAPRLSGRPRLRAPGGAGASH